MAEIVLDGVEKVYAGSVRAVADVNLTIRSGEFMVLVGPSGCGKSTLLRMIVGLEEVTEGSIMIGGRDVTETRPGARDIAMVFQNYALYPHMTVRKNLGYGLMVRKMPKAEIDTRVEEVAKMLGLDAMLDRRPAALSGGQRQRVAMGRAIIRQPQAFLMDEPLSNLDAKLRVDMRSELARLHERLGVTTVYVTHDQIEAMTLGQRVAVMRDGYIQQVDTPQILYNEPVNLFVAAFIGSPSMNLVEARVDVDNIEFGGFRIPLDAGRRPAEAPPGPVILGIRPEDFEDARFSGEDLASIEVDAAVVEDLGAERHVVFRIDAPKVQTAATKAVSEEREEAALLREDRAIFTARVDPRSSAAAGQRLQLTVNSGSFHFFDLETGETLRRGSGAEALAAAPA